VSLFITVPIARLHARADGHDWSALPRVLGGGDLLSLGIGAVIGAGIFVLTGQVAGTHTGPAIVLAMGRQADRMLNVRERSLNYCTTGQSSVVPLGTHRRASSP
jgi:hypothetical protein